MSLQENSIFSIIIIYW